MPCVCCIDDCKGVNVDESYEMTEEFDIYDKEAWAIIVGNFELPVNVLESYLCCALTSMSVLFTA